MTNKMKIIIVAITWFIVVVGVSLILLTGRGIGFEEVYHVYEDSESIYYYTRGESSIGKNLVRFDLETREFENVHSDKNIDTSAYYNSSRYNSPLVYSRTHRDFFNVVTGELTNREYFERCLTSDVSACYGISDDLVVMEYDVDNAIGFMLYQISTNEIVFDRVDTPFKGQYDQNHVGEFHYFPTSNKFLYNVDGFNKIWITDDSYNLMLEFDEYYLVDLTTGEEEILSDEIYNKIKYTYTLATDDYLYVYNDDTYKVEKYNSDMELVHSNDFAFFSESSGISIEYSRLSPILCDKNGMYEFNDNGNAVKLVHNYIEEPQKGNLIGFIFEISPSHVIYKVETMFLEANYFVIYDLKTNEEIYRGTSLEF